MKRLLLYVHYNREDALSQHVIFQLNALRKSYDRIVLISNSKLATSSVAQLPVDDFLQRKNVGFDFKAWSDGMVKVGFERLKQFDTVTIMNDTTFGPIFDFNSILTKMDNSDADFWGITDNRAHVAEIGGSEHNLKAHIQSYFITFNQNIVLHPSFEAFWGNIQQYDDVNRVILEYETQVTDYFCKAGFNYGVLFNTQNEDISAMQNSDFSIFGLTKLLEHGVPFIKVKAFIHNAEKNDIKATFMDIMRVSDYPTDLIVDHMTFADYPDRNYMLCPKVLRFESLKSTQQQVGIHIHSQDIDAVTRAINDFDLYLSNYDLYLTTSSAEICRYFDHKVKKVVLVDDHLNDILAWQQIHKALSCYPVAGHFELSDFDKTVDVLLKPAGKIMAYLSANDSVGLVLSDLSSGVEESNSDSTWPVMAQLWNSIYPNNEKNLKKQDVYIKSNTTNLWYKPQALEKLLAIELDRIMEIANQDTVLIAQSFTNLFPYASWANGFDFRLSQSQPLTGFELQRIVADQISRQVEVSDSENGVYPTVDKKTRSIFRKLKSLQRKLKGMNE